MPRKRELTWQPGSGRRQGRWRRKYQGRTVYLCSARCRSDSDGYRRALAIWRTKKAEIDAEDAAQPKPHQRQYEVVIQEWEGVLCWSVEHADERHAALAREKLAELRLRLDRAIPPPVTAEDRLWSRFTWPQETLESIAVLIGGGARPLPDEDLPHVDPANLVRPGEWATTRLDGSPARIQQEIWRDRLNQQEEREGPDETIEAHVSRSLAEEQTRVDGGEL